jgi:hypothetical protein
MAGSVISPTAGAICRNGRNRNTGIRQPSSGMPKLHSFGILSRLIISEPEKANISTSG